MAIVRKNFLGFVTAYDSASGENQLLPVQCVTLALLGSILGSHPSTGILEKPHCFPNDPMLTTTHQQRVLLDVDMENGFPLDK